MIETLDAVFLQGRVFQELLLSDHGAPSRVSVAAEEPLPRLHAAASGACPPASITGEVMKHLRKIHVFYAGGVPVLLWGEPPSTCKQDLLHRVQNVASLIQERLLADFPRTEVRSAQAIFYRRQVLRGSGPLPDSDTRRFLLRGVRQLAPLCGCEEAAAVLQYSGVIPYMIKLMALGQPLADRTNQQAWARLLDDDV